MFRPLFKRGRVHLVSRSSGFPTSACLLEWKYNDG